MTNSPVTPTPSLLFKFYEKRDEKRQQPGATSRFEIEAPDLAGSFVNVDEEAIRVNHFSIGLDIGLTGSVQKSTADVQFIGKLKLFLNEYEALELDIKSAYSGDFSRSMKLYKLALEALGALREHMRDITRVEAMIILRQCTSALSFLHSQEPAIIHRDIKPHNILVQQRDKGGANSYIVVKLCDFGLAREIPQGQIDSQPGTPRYAPREYYPVGGYQPPLGVKIDIWCLGLGMTNIAKEPIAALLTDAIKGTLKRGLNYSNDELFKSIEARIRTLGLKGEVRQCLQMWLDTTRKNKDFSDIATPFVSLLPGLQLISSHCQDVHVGLKSNG
ncbi:unnamed protein product [Clonostachys byssicola]|uniref:Protein kinase domain-containing protein n=1 Tax=Clonostachys byssicola TaxID=160290 RepID=A0A9N9UAY3_9HYPO|nr:unnamed protein product [Clonostachys byssicola]